MLKIYDSWHCNEPVWRCTRATRRRLTCQREDLREGERSRFLRATFFQKFRPEILQRHCPPSDDPARRWWLSHIVLTRKRFQIYRHPSFLTGFEKQFNLFRNFNDTNTGHRTRPFNTNLNSSQLLGSNERCKRIWQLSGKFGSNLK